MLNFTYLSNLSYAFILFYSFYVKFNSLDNDDINSIILFENGQVFTQYVDKDGNPTMESPYNPNGSMMAIEGIISENGRVIGKMAHSERQGDNRFKNIYGEMDQLIFEAGVKYFK